MASAVPFERDVDCPNLPLAAGSRFFTLWSGGKDSCLSLFKAKQAGCDPALLLTMLSPETERSKTHALDRRLIEAQASALGIPLQTYAFEEQRSDDYERALLAELERLPGGIEGGVFGDIKYGLAWANRVCAKVGVTAWLPLWRVDPTATFNEFLELGFKSVIVCCSNSLLGREALGEELTPELLELIKSKGIDPMGEDNEYHTFVYDGPIFSSPVPFRRGAVRRVSDYWVNELELGSR